MKRNFIMADTNFTGFKTSPLADDAAYQAWEIKAHAKAVWALLEDVKGNHPETEVALVSVSYVLSSIERCCNHLANSISCNLVDKAA